MAEATQAVALACIISPTAREQCQRRGQQRNYYEYGLNPPHRGIAYHIWMHFLSTLASTKVKPEVFPAMNLPLEKLRVRLENPCCHSN